MSQQSADSNLVAPANGRAPRVCGSVHETHVCILIVDTLAGEYPVLLVVVVVDEDRVGVNTSTHDL